MDLATWVKQAYGLGDEVQSALEMNLQLCAKSISALNAVTPRFDEETLTGAMIGAFVGSYPLCAASFPAASDDALQWRSYGKSDRGQFGESRAGADFALVLLIPNRAPRLAIFQAKSDAPERKVANRIYVGQIKKVKTYPRDAHGKIDKTSNDFTIERRNQLKALTNTALQIQRCAESNPGLSDLRWVHYLGQFESGVVAVPISEIASTVQISITWASVETVDLRPGLGVALDELLRDACLDQPRYWLKLTAGEEKLLPNPVNLTHLAEMLPVVVGGGEGFMRMAFTITDIEPIPLSADIFAAPPPAPDAVVATSSPKM